MPESTCLPTFYSLQTQGCELNLSYTAQVAEAHYERNAYINLFLFAYIR